MKVTLVFSLIIVIFNGNVFGSKQALRSSKDTVPHYVRCNCGKNENRELEGSYRNCENGGRCGRGDLMERLAYGRYAEENDRCGCVKGEARNRKQKNYDADRCDCFGNVRSRDRCSCGGGKDNVARCACDDKPTMIYIGGSDSLESSEQEQSDEMDNGGESPQAMTELLHEYGRDFLMIGKVLSEVARRSNYIGATNDGSPIRRQNPEV